MASATRVRDSKRVGEQYSELITHETMDAEGSGGAYSDTFETGPENCEGANKVTLELWNDHATDDSTHKIFTGPTSSGPWEQKPDSVTTYNLTHAGATKTIKLDGPVSWVKIQSISQAVGALADGLNCKVTKDY